MGFEYTRRNAGALEEKRCSPEVGEEAAAARAKHVGGKGLQSPPPSPAGGRGCGWDQEAGLGAGLGTEQPGHGSRLHAQSRRPRLGDAELSGRVDRRSTPPAAVDGVSRPLKRHAETHPRWRRSGRAEGEPWVGTSAPEGRGRELAGPPPQERGGRLGLPVSGTETEISWSRLRSSRHL